MTLNIFGVGTDIVKNSRIKKLIKNKKFINRIFTSSEIKDSKKINHKVSALCIPGKANLSRKALQRCVDGGHGINRVPRRYRSGHDANQG